MMDAFKIEPIHKYISVKGGFAYKSHDFIKSGVPVLRIKNIKARKVDSTDVVFVTEDIAHKTANYYIHSGDILISMTGSGIHAPDSMMP